MTDGRSGGGGRGGGRGGEEGAEVNRLQDESGAVSSGEGTYKPQTMTPTRPNAPNYLPGIHPLSPSLSLSFL